MTLDKKEVLSESPKSPFLNEPKFIEGFGSYYPETLEYEGEKYIVYQKPHKLFYPNVYLVKVIKLASGLEYGDKRRKYSSMIFNNGKIKPFTLGISVNNRAEMNTKHPIIETEKNGYMKYDENLNCSNLEGLPKGYRPSRWNDDRGTVQLYCDKKDKSHSMIYGIDENYKLKPIEGIPEGMYINDIQHGNIATVVSYEKKDGDSYEQYFYDSATKKISPFVFKGFENQTYKVEAFWTEGNVISIINDQGKPIYFYFDGKPEINDIVVTNIDAKISELNKKSETARLFSISGEDNKEGFYHYKKGVIKPFSGLKGKEIIGYTETYQFINAKSSVKALVIISEDRMHRECRTFDESGTIRPFQGLKEGWKAGDRIRQSSNGNFFFLPIEIKGFGETHSLLSKDSQRIVLYKDMLITGINPKSKTLEIVTHEGPDCDIQLNNDERNAFMKNRDPNYQEKSVDTTKKKTKADLGANLQQ